MQKVDVSGYIGAARILDKIALRLETSGTSQELKLASNLRFRAAYDFKVASGLATAGRSSRILLAKFAVRQDEKAQEDMHRSDYSSYNLEGVHDRILKVHEIISMAAEVETIWHGSQHSSGIVAVLVAHTVALTAPVPISEKNELKKAVRRIA